jgi:type VI secretion system FHA domain protein
LIALSQAQGVDAGGSASPSFDGVAAMTLNLTVISYAGRKPASPLAVSFGDRGGIIGREPNCDWVLEDPNGHVSKRHGRIEYVSGQYRIKDTSTNGIFLGDGGKRLGFGVSAVLKDGDLLHIGGYDIVVQLSVVEEAPRRTARPGIGPAGGESFDEAAAVLSRLANMVGQPAAPAPAAAHRSTQPATGAVAGSPAVEPGAVKTPPRQEAARAWGSPTASPGAAKRAPAATPAARTQAAAPVAQEARDRATAPAVQGRSIAQEARGERPGSGPIATVLDRAAVQEARDRAAAQEARDRAAAQEARDRAAAQEARDRIAAQAVRDQAAAARSRAFEPAASLVATPGDDLDTGGRDTPRPVARPQQNRAARYDTGVGSAVIEDADTEDADNQPSVSWKSPPGRDAGAAGWLRWPSADSSAEMFGVPQDDGTLTLARVAEAVPIQPATLLDQVPLPPLAPDALEPLDLTGFEEEAVAAREAAANALAVVPQRKRATFGGWALAFSLFAAFIVAADLWVDRPVAIYLHRHVVAPGVIETFENCVLGLMPLGAVMMLICGALALSGKSLPRWAEAGTLSAFSLFWALPSTFFLLKPAFGRYDTTQFFSEPSLYGFAPFHGTVQSGFPSEHATIVAAVFSVFWIFFPRLRPLSSAMIGLVIGGLILLSWHFLSDVAAGLFVGTTSGIMTVRLWRNAQVAR